MRSCNAFATESVAGNEISMGTSSAGSADREGLHFVFSRNSTVHGSFVPGGTRLVYHGLPSVKTLGYCQEITNKYLQRFLGGVYMDIQI